MAERMQHFTPSEQRNSIIRITSYHDKNPVGTLEHNYHPQGTAFANLTQFLFLMEQLQDAMDFPQRTMEPRRFKEDAPPPMPMSTTSNGKAPPLATFKLRLLFRQNASWQGVVTWMEQRQESHFRSALELVFLIDSVLN